MYTAMEQGQTAPMGQNLDVNRKALSLYPFVASFKEISLKSDFRAGGIQPTGGGGAGGGGVQSFDVNRNVLSLWLSLASFKS